MNNGPFNDGQRPSRDGDRFFVTTHWSVVLAAGEILSPNAEEALSKLCRTYWYPLYAFVRRKGYGREEAQDLTQAFFARLLEKNVFAQADRDRGRFRTFLLAAVQHFLADEWDKSRRLKRGGGCHIVSFDSLSAEERYSQEPADLADAAKLYERRWVTALLDRVLVQLEAGYRQAGKAELFEALRSSLLLDDDRVSYRELGVPLQLSEAAVKQAVLRLRRRYRELFREEIAQTVTDPSEADEELKHLFSVLAG